MDWTQNYSPEIGLWWVDKPGHTPGTINLTRTHAVAQGACAMLTACQLGEIGRIDTLKVLSAIRAKQSQENTPGKFGQVCFFYEEPTNHDGNASFFAGMPLALLWSEFKDLLEPRSQELLKTILADLSVWFSGKLEHDKAFYPNSYLGELVVSWLVASASDDRQAMSRVQGLLNRLIARYKTDGWGWGEDLSDIYSKILLDQLSMLVFLTRGLSGQTQAGLLDLLNHLLMLDDQFRPGPRMPSIRSYSFRETPHHPDPARGLRLESYRQSVRPWAAGETINFRHVAPIGNLLYLRGWHDRVNPVRPRKPQLVVDCHAGNKAKAWVFDDTRFGAMARFPIMPSGENQEWGLAWQSMPVGYWHERGDWAYMQWRVQPKADPATQPEPCPIGHPALFSKTSNLGAIRKALTNDIQPPLFGETFTLWSDAGVLILRRMRSITRNWAWLSDGMKVVDFSVKPAELAETELAEPGPGIHHLHIPYPARTIGLTYLDPWKHRKPMLDNSSEGTLNYAVQLTPDDSRGYVGLWALMFDVKTSEACSAPRFEITDNSDNIPRSKTETAFVLAWQWPGHAWRVRIDPLAEVGLVNCS